MFSMRVALCRDAMMLVVLTTASVRITVRSLVGNTVTRAGGASVILSASRLLCTTTSVLMGGTTGAETSVSQ